LTQGGSSQTKAADTGVDRNKSAETTLSLGKQPGMLEQGARPPSQVEEQTMTMTRSEMQRMIAEAVAAQIKQVQVEQPRVEQPRVEQPRVEQPRIVLPPHDSEQQAQSNERQIGRAEEEESSIQQVDENGPIINFRPADVRKVERPHNDALMITAQVSRYEVQRVFFDTGSSVNVIFYDCFKRVELDIQLTPLHTLLFGFTGSEVSPLGEAMLAVVLGKGDLRKVKMVRFVVIDVESAYNVILERPALNAFQAVMSTYHMKLKFPVGDRVGEGRGDQKLSRTCYQIAVKTNQWAEVKEKKKPIS
ncbi:Unknown protein, partial [Striga hermonthica]